MERPLAGKRPFVPRPLGPQALSDLRSAREERAVRGLPGRSRRPVALVVDRARNSLCHKYVRDLPDILLPTDCLVLNDTRVVPARLVGFRTQTGGHWEGLFLETNEEGLWRVMCKTRGTLVSGEPVTLLDLEGREDILLHLGVPERIKASHKGDNNIYIYLPNE